MKCRLILAIAILFLSFVSAPVLLAQVNKVLSLDGNGDYVEITDSSTLNNLSSQVTMEAWIRATAFPNEWMPIVYKGDGGSSNNRSYTLWLNRNGSLLWHLLLVVQVSYISVRQV